jgi:thiazole synthase ThiGH ThiG subunit
MDINLDTLKIGEKYFNSRLMLGTGNIELHMMLFLVLKIANVKL